MCVCVVGEECESLGDMTEQQDRAESQPNRHRASEVHAKFPQGHKLSLKGQRILSNTFSSFQYLTALSNISIHVNAWSKRAIFYEREADLKVIHGTNMMKFDKSSGKYIYLISSHLSSHWSLTDKP